MDVASMMYGLDDWDLIVVSRILPKGLTAEVFSYLNIVHTLTLVIHFMLSHSFLL